jgi:hypothetical protein
VPFKSRIGSYVGSSETIIHHVTSFYFSHN